MFKGKNKCLNEDEETVRPRDGPVKVRFFGPWDVEMPFRGHQIELASSEGSQVNAGILVSGQVIWKIRRLGESIKELLNIEFGSAGDDNLEPWCLRGGIGQDLQETWAPSSVATLVKRVNHKDEGVFRVDRKGAEEIKEE